MKAPARILMTVVVGTAAAFGLPGLWLGAVQDSDTAYAEELVSSIARGGRLYDNWYGVFGEDGPEETHPSYPTDIDRTGAGTWRCKECHGWDYLGADGAYGSGSHYTGFIGVSAFDGDAGALAAILGDATHAYTEAMLGDADIADLALFLTDGLVDMNAVIDRETKTALGDAGAGEPLYNTLCVNCHGFDGKAMEDVPAMGELSNDNPWEVLHKMLNGQPDEDMPALLALDLQISASILAYMQTLPE